MTDHASISGALPWYAANALDEDERQEIERHLDSCEACRERLSDLRRFAQLGAATTTERALEHVAPSLLVEYAEHPETLGEETVRWIEGRLAACGTCRDAHASLLQVGEALALDADSAFFAETTSERVGVWGWLRITLLHPAPALAYLLIAAIGLPALWHLRSPGDPAAAVQAVALSGERTQRDEDVVVETLAIELEDMNRPVLVELITELREEDLQGGALQFAVELSEEGRPVWTERRDAAAFLVRDGRVVLPQVLDPRILSVGREYQLAIRAQKPGDPLDGQALFKRRVRFLKK